MTGNGLHSFSYSPGVAKGSFFTSPFSHDSFPGHWLFRSFVGGGRRGGHGFPTSVLNPNKAVFTLDTSSRILTTNDMCSLLLGESEEKLCGGSRRLSDFITCPVTARYLANLAPHSSHSLEDLTPDPLTAPGTSSHPGDMNGKKSSVMLSGRVVNVKKGEHGNQLCSLWLKGLPQEEGKEQRWVAVLEPIEVTIAKVTIDHNGTILDVDDAFRGLFSLQDTSVASMDNILLLIPSLRIPSSPSSSASPPPLRKEVEIQQCTGVTVKQNNFPLCVQLSRHLPQPNATYTLPTHTPLLRLNILVFSNLSGLVVLDASGSIVDCNSNFTNFLLGYGLGELKGQSITHIIPSFYVDVMGGLEMTCEDEVSTGSFWQEENEEEEEIEEEEEDKDTHKENLNENEKQIKSPPVTVTTTAMEDITNSLNSMDLKSQPQQCLYNTWVDDKHVENNKTVITSTPASNRCSSTTTANNKSIHDPINQGTYFSYGRHKDGSDIKLIYQVRRVDEEKGEQDGGEATFYYLWILNDRDGQLDEAPSTQDLTRTSQHDTAELSLGHAITREAREHQKQQQHHGEEKQREQNIDEELQEEGDETVNSYCPSLPSSSSPLIPVPLSSSSECGEDEEHSHTCTEGSSGAEYSLNHSRRGGRHLSSAPDGEKELQEEGEFSQHYQVLKQIGKGAFGCVKLTHRYSDGLLVVTKFIKKAKVYSDSWVDDALLGRSVPLEVSLLMSLDHPNIITVLDVFENDGYFQLVMEKLGSGMDLFEFIDRSPRMDEPLAAHIFRQIVSALTYLHSLNIVHRDVKDENVILDNQFHVKLIDFGSSTFSSPGKEFSQFAGTVEYCSPEVLMGNKYTGYEVEVWSLGVTLYTLVYWENPFYDVDDTIKGVLNIPYEHSPELMSLLRGMIEKDVKARLTLAQVEQHPWTKLPCNPDHYTFHHVVPCTKRERNPKHYLSEYMQSTNDTSASFSTSSRSFLDEEPQPHHLGSTSPPLPIRRANSATTPRCPSHPCKKERLWSATPLSAPPDTHLDPRSEDCDHDRCMTCSTHSRASTTHSLSSIRSTITVDSASFSVCSPHSSSSPSSALTSHSSSTSPSTTPTASDWVNTQLKSSCTSSTSPESSIPLSESIPVSGQL